MVVLFRWPKNSCWLDLGHDRHVAVHALLRLPHAHRRIELIGTVGVDAVPILRATVVSLGSAEATQVCVSMGRGAAWMHVS